jgi:hypothetical protein
MAKKKPKSGRITLRVDPEVHHQLEEIAKGLMLDVNGLLKLIIQRSLGEFAVLAHFFKEDAAPEKLRPKPVAWMEANPERHPKEFLAEFRADLQKRLLRGMVGETPSAGEGT